jgi:hypothetical protein
MLRAGVVLAATMAGALAFGCGEEQDVDPSAYEIRDALSRAMKEDVGSISSIECFYLPPGPDAPHPTYRCQLGAGETWHDNVLVHGRRDGTFSWEDKSGSTRDLERGELTIKR